MTDHLKRHWKKWVAAAVLVFVAFGLGRWTGGDDPEDGEAVAEEEGEEDEVEEWTCPMHPEVREPEFGTCPICHMDLVPADDVGDNGSDIPSVQIGEDAKRLAGVRNAEVEAGPVTHDLDVFGRVEVEEDAEVDIAAWTGGRIESLEVSARGERVERGQLLARIYSPELYSAQRSLVQAVRNKEEARDSESERRVRAAESSIRSARTELRLLGVDERQIDEIQETKQARETVDVFATAAGTIQQRHVQAGDYVDKGEQILSLAPLETVWGQLEIYERDLGRVSEGTAVTVEVPGLDGRELEGRIDFLSPKVDERRRVVEARVVLPNPEGDLKPGMYLNGTIETAIEDEETLSIPRSAVLWTGKRSLVYVYDTELDPPGYVPQPVELGPRIGERYVIEKGLSEGDTVAERGAFRIDAELQLRDGPTMMSEIHDEGEVPMEGETVEVPDEGAEFDPPIEPEQLPEDQDVWYCDMGTVEWAQGEEGDAECPVCGMDLTHRPAEHDHDEHDHDHEHDHEGHDHVH